MTSNEVLIAVMGATGTGKSTFINLISGSNFNTGSSLMSCTQAVQTTSPFTCLGRRVTLIDTPGFDDSVRTDSEILEVIANHLSTAYRNNKKLNGVIYIHRISDVRMGGISRRNFRMFRDVCGDTTLNNVVVVTNMWGEVTPDLGRDREIQLATNPSLFKPVLDKGAKMIRHTNTKESAQEILRPFLDKVPMTLQIQREIVQEGKAIRDTAAAAVIKEQEDKEREEQRRRHEEELRKQREQAEMEARKREEERQRELEAARRAHEAELARQRAIEAQMREEARVAELQRQRAAAQLRARLEAEAAARRAQEAEAERVRQAMAEQDRRAREEQERLQRELAAMRARQRDDDGGCIVC